MGASWLPGMSHHASLGPQLPGRAPLPAASMGGAFSCSSSSPLSVSALCLQLGRVFAAYILRLSETNCLQNTQWNLTPMMQSRMLSCPGDKLSEYLTLV